ncbi:MAG: hypothetical protein GY853_15610 [PVC group bacterium]|nr:hypothetical protein [PVC group bacterium]
MDWKKSILSLVAVFGFIGVIAGVFDHFNSQTEKIIRNEMNTIYNTKEIKELSENIDKITPHVETLIKLFEKAEFIVLRNEEDCHEDDEECKRELLERYVKRR